MDIEEMIGKKEKLEIQIRDGINAFMMETKVIVDNIDIGIELIHLERGGVHEIREIFLSVQL
jgi:hypothetical protein